MQTLTVSIEHLTDDGLEFLLQRLCGLGERTLADWTYFGPLIEENEIELAYSESNSEWDASIRDNDELQYITGNTVRSAVGKLVLKKHILDNPQNTYTLKMPLREAIGFIDRGHFGGTEIDLIVAETIDPSGQSIVELSLRTE